MLFRATFEDTKSNWNNFCMFSPKMWGRANIWCLIFLLISSFFRVVAFLNFVLVPTLHWCHNFFCLLELMLLWPFSVPDNGFDTHTHHFCLHHHKDHHNLKSTSLLHLLYRIVMLSIIDMIMFMMIFIMNMIITEMILQTIMIWP